MNVRTVNLSEQQLPVAPQQPEGRENDSVIDGTLDRASSTYSLVALFDEISRLHADKVAIVCGSEQMTYDELNRAGNRFAHRLIRMNLEPDAIIAIYLDRSIEMLSAMLGILKAGKAYLPIDSSYPIARVVQTLEDARPAVLITDQRLGAGLPAIPSEVLFVNQQATVDEESIGLHQILADDLAYVMYTSGSTGKPKGVLVTHRNVMRLLRETKRWFHFDENDVWTMFHSFAFDFSVWEIWGCLLTGGKLIVVSFAVSRSPEDFYTLLADQEVTVLNQTPSAFYLLSRLEEMGAARPLSLRVVIFGGEALQFRALRPWFKRHGEVKPKLVNMYGITETTVHVTYRIVSARDAEIEQESLIGIPIPDMQIHLLDSEGQPVADGEVGEICVGGGGVARGYLNRPELTAERFVPDPFGTHNSLLYRSGDLARRRPDKELVYLGRGDGQVKINGFRIELGEVETAISDYPGVQQVCVVAHLDEGGSRRLAAYYVMADGLHLPVYMLSDFLSRRLPAQMMPAFYTQLSEMPLTGNGKTDRAALPKPETGSKTARFDQGSQMQEEVAAIWRKVLDAPNVDLDDNFFDIGGSSLLLIAARSQLQKQLGRQIPITWMFEFTTVKALAGKLSENHTTSASDPAIANKTSIRVVEQQASKQREAFARLRAMKGAAR
jgi:amino acid adenylation domain-containing protein